MHLLKYMLLKDRVLSRLKVDTLVAFHVFANINGLEGQQECEVEIKLYRVLNVFQVEMS